MYTHTLIQLCNPTACSRVPGSSFAALPQRIGSQQSLRLGIYKYANKEGLKKIELLMTFPLGIYFSIFSEVALPL